MLSEKVIEQLTERLVARIEEGNLYILKKIGEGVKEIGTLIPSQAQALSQVLKYGGSYQEIVKKLAQITDLNVKDIYKIFDEVAKYDYQFAEQFYKYRGLEFIPYERNYALQNQVRALAKITADKYMNLSNTTVVGFNVRDLDGKIRFKGLQETYFNTIDQAVLNVAQGKESFTQQMNRAIKTLGGSGIKTVDYESGYHRRLDSAVRMNIQGALRNLHNETQKIVGEQFGSDGVEISVHSNPAEDHEEAQGRQFSNSEFLKLQETGKARDFTGKSINLHRHTKNGVEKGFRPISEWNCYHYNFAIVLGVSKPQYSDSELQEIIDRNEEGFEIDGKHYSMYEGTQLQRKIETEIRRQRDILATAKASGLEDLELETQGKINLLNRKYVELSKVSNLPRKLDRIGIAK